MVPTSPLDTTATLLDSLPRVQPQISARRRPKNPNGATISAYCIDNSHRYYNNVDMSDAPDAAEVAATEEAMRVAKLMEARFMEEHRRKERMRMEIREEIMEEHRKLAVRVGIVGGVLALLGAGAVAAWMMI